MRVRIPADVEIPIRLFGSLTLKDVGRLAAPPALTYILYVSSAPVMPGFAALAAAVVVGVVWYKFRYRGLRLDELVYHGVRWTAGKKEIEGSDIESVEKQYVETRDGSLVAFIKVDSVNLDALTRTGQKAVHEIYGELLDSIEYQVKVHSRQKRFDLEEYTDQLEELEKDPERLRDGYIDHCHRLSSGELVTTDHVVSVKVSPGNDTELFGKLRGGKPDESGRSALVSELNSRCREVRSALNRGDLAADRVQGGELRQLAHSFNTAMPEPGPGWTTTRPGKFGEYRKTLYISEYPSPAELAWVCDVLRVDGLVDVTQVVEPQDPGETVKRLEKIREKLGAEIDSFLNAGYFGVNDLERRFDDANWFLNLLVDREDKPFRYGVYITVHSENEERCERALDAVEKRLKTKQIEYEETYLRTDKAFKSRSPFYESGLDQKLLVPTRSVAAGLPFATQDSNHGSGVVYGLDSSDEVPMLLDRFSWDSYTSARFGMTGSGKSYASKLELIRAWLAYPDLRVVVVDPKKEYGYLVKTLSPSDNPVHSLDEDFRLEDKVLSFEPDERGRGENVKQLTSLVERLYQETSQDDKPTLVLIDEAHNLLNSEKGRQVLSQWVREARDTNTALSLISQNAADFTYCREGRAILDNTKIKTFHFHDRVPDHVVDYFDLSGSEVRTLKNLKTGGDGYSEAVFKVSGKVDTTLWITASIEEHSVIEAGSSEEGSTPEIPVSNENDVETVEQENEVGEGSSPEAEESEVDDGAVEDDGSDSNGDSSWSKPSVPASGDVPTDKLKTAAGDLLMILTAGTVGIGGALILNGVLPGEFWNFVWAPIAGVMAYHYDRILSRFGGVGL